MRRDEATSLLEQLLERLYADERLLKLVERVYVYGSYVSGAPTVRDLDLDVEFVPLHERDFAAGDPLEALTRSERTLDVIVDRAYQFSPSSPWLSPLYERGLAQPQAFERLANVAARPPTVLPLDYSLPVLAGDERRLELVERRLLAALVAAGALTLAEAPQRWFQRVFHTSSAWSLAQALRQREQLYWRPGRRLLVAARGDDYEARLCAVLEEQGLLWYDLVARA